MSSLFRRPSGPPCPSLFRRAPPLSRRPICLRRRRRLCDCPPPFPFAPSYRCRARVVRMSPHRPSFTAAAAAAMDEQQQHRRHHRSPPYTVFIEGNVGSGKTTFLELFAGCPNVFTAKEPVNKWQDVCGHNFLVSRTGRKRDDEKGFFFFTRPVVLVCCGPGPDVRGPETLEFRVPVDRAEDHAGTAPGPAGPRPEHQNHGAVDLQRQVPCPPARFRTRGTRSRDLLVRYARSCVPRVCFQRLKAPYLF